jgi:hypothetical protein
VVQTDVVKPSVVFSRYFKAKPPFNQEKKKSEFPDAFALEALRTFCVENGSRVTIVSGDSDCKAACEEDDRLKYVEKLELLLQSLQENSALLAAAKDALTHLEQEIQKQIAEECRTLEFFVADSLATVTEVTDSQVHVQQRYIVDVTNTAIVFSIEAWIDFSVSVNYPSRPFTNGSGKWGIERLPRNRLATNVNNSEPLLCGESFSFVGTASWRAAEPDSAQLVNLSISDPHAVPVYYDDYTS